MYTNQENNVHRGRQKVLTHGTWDHYQCHCVYVPSTRAERIFRTIDFFPHSCATPQSSPLDDATRAVNALTNALLGRLPNAPYGELRDAQIRAITKLSEIFSKITRNTRQHNPDNPKLPRVATKQNQHATQPRVSSTKNPTLRNQHTPPPIEYNLPLPKSAPHCIPLDDDDNSTNTAEIPDPIMTPRYNLCAHHQPATTAIVLLVLNQQTGNLEEYHALMKGDDKEIWYKAYGNNLCRLVQGMPGRKHRMDVSTSTIKFISK